MRKGNSLISPALNEIQAAAYAGFSRWAHFLIARKRGLFPEPVRNLPGVGPLWTRQQTDQWLGLAEAPGSKSALERDEEEARARIQRRRKAALR